MPLVRLKNGREISPYPAVKRLLDSLPETVRQQAESAYEIFKQDPWHPSLQYKQVGPNTYSVRIGLHHRALGIRSETTIVWYWIGTHAEYDKLI